MIELDSNTMCQRLSARGPESRPYRPPDSPAKLRRIIWKWGMGGGSGMMDPIKQRFACTHIFPVPTVTYMQNLSYYFRSVHQLTQMISFLSTLTCGCMV